LQPQKGRPAISDESSEDHSDSENSSNGSSRSSRSSRGKKGPKTDQAAAWQVAHAVQKQKGTGAGLLGRGGAKNQAGGKWRPQGGPLAESAEHCTAEWLPRLANHAVAAPHRLPRHSVPHLTVEAHQQWHHQTQQQQAARQSWFIREEIEDAQAGCMPSGHPHFHAPGPVAEATNILRKYGALAAARETPSPSSSDSEGRGRAGHNQQHHKSSEPPINNRIWGSTMQEGGEGKDGADFKQSSAALQPSTPPAWHMASPQQGYYHNNPWQQAGGRKQDLAASGAGLQASGSGAVDVDGIALRVEQSTPLHVACWEWLQVTVLEGDPIILEPLPAPTLHAQAALRPSTAPASSPPGKTGSQAQAKGSSRGATRRGGPPVTRFQYPSWFLTTCLVTLYLIIFHFLAALRMGDTIAGCLEVCACVGRRRDPCNLLHTHP
jgi:hypothetical protein